MSAAIRTLIVEDNPTVRQALADLVAEDTGLEVVGLAADAWEGVRGARELHPDVALVDVKMPGGGGPTATRGMLKLNPAPRVVAMSASRDHDAIVEMLRAGAVGYLVKGGPSADVASAIKRAARGESSLSPPAADRLIEAVVEQTKGDEAIAAERAEKAGRIHRAIDNEEIVSVYQPIFDLNSGKPAGYEALSRFTGKPERGPLQWFAEADEVGLGFDLEIAAASFAMRVASAHLDEQLARGFLSVNASPATLLTEGFAETLGEGFPPDRVVVEVTEHARIEDYAEFKQAFSGLRSQGVRLAVDDVGAGYASLRHILSLEPDVIKLDLSLTRDIESDRRKRALAAALISFAAETESTVVAEGIETEPELDALVTLGAQLGQGYHLGRPGPLGNLGDNGSGRG